MILAKEELESFDEGEASRASDCTLYILSIIYSPLLHTLAIG
jgi:hypothetical protein